MLNGKCILTTMTSFLHNLPTYTSPLNYSPLIDVIISPPLSRKVIQSKLNNGGEVKYKTPRQSVSVRNSISVLGHFGVIKLLCPAQRKINEVNITWSNVSALQDTRTPLRSNVTDKNGYNYYFSLYLFALYSIGP